MFQPSLNICYKKILLNLVEVFCVFFFLEKSGQEEQMVKKKLKIWQKQNMWNPAA